MDDRLVEVKIDLSDVAPLPEDPLADELIECAKNGRLARMREIVAERPILAHEATDEEGNTPLHWAAYTRRRDCVEFLLDQHVDVDQPNQVEGHTPLHWALIRGANDVVGILIRSGASVTLTDERGYQALHHAVQYNNAAGACYLIKRCNVDVNAVDQQGHTPIHWAAYRGHERMARLLCDHGASVSVRDRKGFTPMHWAAAKNNRPVIDVLFEYDGHDCLGVASKEGETPEDLAERKENKKLAILLRKWGATEYVKLEQKKYYRIYWAVISAAFTSFLFLLVNHLPLWTIPVICFGLFYGFRFSSLSRFWDAKSIRNPFWLAWYLAMFLYMTMVYVKHLAPVVFPLHPTRETMFVLCSFLLFVLFGWCMVADPGQIDPDPAKLERLFDEMEAGQSVGDVCVSCMIPKAIRSKHCRACNRCVARFDHHCNWMNSDVGAFNHRLFLFVIAYLMVIKLWFCSILWEVLMSRPIPKNLAWYMLPIHLYTYENGVFVLLLFLLMHFVWEAILLYQQLASVFANLTFNEYQNHGRYEYLAGHPFDHGYLPNFREFLFEDKRKWLTMMRPPARLDLV